jgi:hypothetical protein
VTAANATAGGHIAYFGYGSLINRATHRTEIVDAIPGRLNGWRRLWRPRPDMPGFPAALLSVRREAGAGCDGLLVIDRAENLAAVDEREGRYRRIRLAPEELSLSIPLADDCPIFVYEAETDVPPHREEPRILQSYLDAVLQGVLREHGEAGVRRFFSETDGFETALMPDREKPTYPRAVLLEEAERALFDTLHAAHLTSLSPRAKQR